MGRGEGPPARSEVPLSWNFPKPPVFPSWEGPRPRSGASRGPTAQVRSILAAVPAPSQELGWRGPVPTATRPHPIPPCWHLLSSLRRFPGFQALSPEVAEAKCVFLVLNQDGALFLPDIRLPGTHQDSCPMWAVAAAAPGAQHGRLRS